MKETTKPVKQGRIRDTTDEHLGEAYQFIGVKRTLRASANSAERRAEKSNDRSREEKP